MPFIMSGGDPKNHENREFAMTQKIIDEHQRLKKLAQEIKEICDKILDIENKGGE